MNIDFHFHLSDAVLGAWDRRGSEPSQQQENVMTGGNFVAVPNVLPTKDSLRKALFDLFRTSECFKSFVLDHFADVLSKAPSAPSMMEWVNLLYEHVSVEQVLGAIENDSDLRSTWERRNCSAKLRYEVQPMVAEVERLSNELQTVKARESICREELAKTRADIEAATMKLAQLEANRLELMTENKMLRTLELDEAKKTEPMLHILEVLLDSQRAELARENERMEQREAQLAQRAEKLAELNEYERELAQREQECVSKAERMHQEQHGITQAQLLIEQDRANVAEKEQRLLNAQVELECLQKQVSDRGIAAEERLQQAQDEKKASAHQLNEARLEKKEVALLQQDIIRRQRSWLTVACTVLVGLIAGTVLTRFPSEVNLSPSVRTSEPLQSPNQVSPTDERTPNANKSVLPQPEAQPKTASVERRASPTAANAPKSDARSGQLARNGSRGGNPNPPRALKVRATAPHQRTADRSDCPEFGKTGGAGGSPGRSYAAP